MPPVRSGPMVPEDLVGGKRGKSRDWAPTDEEYIALQDAARDVRDRTILYVLAEGGFRVSEFVAIRPWWLEDGSVVIPRSDPKTGFRTKTDMSARQIPLKLMSRYAWDLLTDYLDAHGRIDFSRRTALQRVRGMGERAGIYVYPHALRAYCATVWGHRLDLIPLMELMGWETPDVARRYIRKSGRRTRRAIREWVMENARI